MDIDKMIDTLKQHGVSCVRSSGRYCGICDDAATALSTLQAENADLRAELEQVKRALAMMWFAYVNSDKETPHSYETEAIEEAERLLGPWAECMPKYLRRGLRED